MYPDARLEEYTRRHDFKRGENVDFEARLFQIELLNFKMYSL